MGVCIRETEKKKRSETRKRVHKVKKDIILQDRGQNTEHWKTGSALKWWKTKKYSFTICKY